jgi:formate hydrogenlyase subunit 6/NADH:ubiquinone oxidoreductase subunit I
MTDEEVYERFVEWLRSYGAFVPESEELLPLVRACYRPEEARLLTGMPFAPLDLEELAALKHADIRDLARALDDLARRGLVFRSDEGGKTTYRLNSLRFVSIRSFFWPGREDEYTRSVASHVSRYYRDGLGDHWKEVQTKGLRVVPIQRTVDDPRRILPYEDVRELLLQQERFAVAHCACRHRARMDASATPCRHETENCLHFGKLADYIIKNELGREITREESEAILARSAEEGLVHAVSNWRSDVDTICNCCRCCCTYFQGFHVLKHSSVMNSSAYEIHTNPETCQGCGLCVKRCPMDALRLETHPAAKNKTGKVSVSISGLCVGCGVCAHKCPTGSLTLKSRPQVLEPPQDVDDLKRRYAQELIAARAARGETVSDEIRLADVSSGESAAALTSDQAAGKEKLN